MSKATSRKLPEEVRETAGIPDPKDIGVQRAMKNLEGFFRKGSEIDEPTIRPKPVRREPPRWERPKWLDED